jgi:hypothetical protein
LTLLACREDQTPVAIEILPKAKTFRLSFRKYFVAYVIQDFGCQKRWWVLFNKEPKDINIKFIKFLIALLPCASHK